jgi:hypothetical protein
MLIAKKSRPDKETGPGLSCAKMQFTESIWEARAGETASWTFKYPHSDERTMLIVITQPGKRLFLSLWSTWYFRFQPGWIMYQLFILLVYILSNPRFQVGHTLSRSVHHCVGIWMFRRLSPLLSLLKYVDQRERKSRLPGWVITISIVKVIRFCR